MSLHKQQYAAVENFNKCVLSMLAYLDSTKTSKSYERSKTKFRTALNVNILSGVETFGTEVYKLRHELHPADVMTFSVINAVNKYQLCDDEVVEMMTKLDKTYNKSSKEVRVKILEHLVNVFEAYEKYLEFQ